MITKETKATIIKDFARKDGDVGSPEVQASILTARINELTEHMKQNKKDFAARRGLLKLVGQRKRVLKFLADQNPDAYLKTVQKLGLRK